MINRAHRGGEVSLRQQQLAAQLGLWPLHAGWKEGREHRKGKREIIVKCVGGGGSEKNEKHSRHRGSEHLPVGVVGVVGAYLAANGQRQDESWTRSQSITKCYSFPLLFKASQML